MKHITIISDATGETAERIVRATLLHYDASDVEVEVVARVRTGDDMRDVVGRAAARDALVVYTIAGDQARGELQALIADTEVAAVDLIGKLLDTVGAHLEQTPTWTPKSLQAVGADYFRRIEAVEFMVSHDDGAMPHELPKADLVLVGISRTTKTPLSAYLAQKGVRVANVPLVLGIAPPVELDDCDPKRVYGLLIRPEALVSIRAARRNVRAMVPDSPYGTRRHIRDELAYARTIFDAHPEWVVVDVSDAPIEVNGADILRTFRERTGFRD